MILQEKSQKLFTDHLGKFRNILDSCNPKQKLSSMSLARCAKVDRKSSLAGRQLLAKEEEEGEEEQWIQKPFLGHDGLEEIF